MMRLCNCYDLNQFGQILHSLVNGTVLQAVSVSLAGKCNFILTVGLLSFMSQLDVH